MPQAILPLFIYKRDDHRQYAYRRDTNHYMKKGSIRNYVETRLNDSTGVFKCVK
jgi:hypothetical protein